MLFTWFEILDILITVVAGSFIFSGLVEVIKKRETLAERLLLSAAIVGPSIILHELGHKFAALSLGLQATFHASYLWLAIGVVLKLVSFPFIFLVPAYVSIIGTATPMEFAWTAFAGPMVNGILFLVCFILLKARSWSMDTTILLHASQNINLFLFVFNLIPIPGFDGAKVWGAFF